MAVRKLTKTDKGDKLYNVNGTYMTKSQMYSTGVVEKDPETGQDVQGRYRVNENTGELERTDMSFSEHWENAPGALKYSPTLRYYTLVIKTLVNG